MTRPDRSSPAPVPLTFSPDLEIIRSDEPETFADLVATLRALMEASSADAARALRPVHAASHAILRGELAVLEHLEPELRQGVFAEPSLFPVMLRCSTDPGDVLHAGVAVPRGLALKIVGVAGERLAGSAGECTQDFVMADAPAFVAADARGFLARLKCPAAGAGRPEVLERAVSAALRGVEALIEAAGGDRMPPKAMDGHRDTHLLGATFHSQVPVLYGPHVAKLQMVPACPALRSLAGETIDMLRGPDALHEAIADFFESQTAVWDLRVQLMTDARTMPIEDASVVWPESDSPFRTVARITVPPQPVWDAARREGAEDELAFSPWYGLAAHRPLGSIMRARRSAYEMSASFRAARNGCPIHEPRGADDLPV